MNRREFLTSAMLAGLGIAVGCKQENSEMKSGPECETGRGITKDICEFFDIVHGEKDDTGACALYAEYVKACEHEPTPVKIDALRDVLSDIVQKNTEITSEQKKQFLENKFIFARMLGLMDTAFTGENSLGGKVQISRKEVIGKNYFAYKEGPIGEVIATSKKLAGIVDPTVVFALIANETDYVNFFNKHEGVRGDFQFTSAHPPEENTFVLPEPKDEAEKHAQERSIVRLRKKRHNEFYDALDDIEDNDIRKQLAFFLSFVFGNLDYIRYEYDQPSDFLTKEERENTCENADFLMALAFYNSDIARIDEDSKKGDAVNTSIKKEKSASAFIETLPFYKGSRAGKLYVPTLLTHYVILKKIDERANALREKGELGDKKTPFHRLASRISKGEVYEHAFQLSLKQNFGIAPKE